MTTEDAWELMNAYHTGLPWTAEHVTAVRLLIDKDLDHFERVWFGKGNSWACIRDLIEAIIRTRDVSEYQPIENT
jgi:hypothetical protein